MLKQTEISDIMDDIMEKNEIPHLFVPRFSREEVQAVSDLLYNAVKNDDGTAAFYEGFPRKNASEFFDDVKYHLGVMCDVRIWDYSYKEKR